MDTGITIIKVTCVLVYAMTNIVLYLYEMMCIKLQEQDTSQIVQGCF